MDIGLCSSSRVLRSIVIVVRDTPVHAVRVKLPPTEPGPECTNAPASYVLLGDGTPASAPVLVRPELTHP